MKLTEFGSRIAHIDLEGGRVEVRPIPEGWAEKYIGARGLGVRYAAGERATGRSALSGEHPLLHERSPDGLGGQHERPLGGSDQVASHRHRDRQPPGWMDRCAAALGRSGRSRLRGPVRAPGLRLRLGGPGGAARRIGDLGQGHPRDRRLLPAALRREGPLGLRHRPGRRADVALRGLAQRRRPGLRTGRNRRRRREQAAQGHRHPGRDEEEPGRRSGRLEERASSGPRRHPRREAHHQSSQGGPLDLRHQLLDEHRQSTSVPSPHGTAS